jgi:menaquinone-dependent protoporphyrinogen oxidase
VSEISDKPCRGFTRLKEVYIVLRSQENSTRGTAGYRMKLLIVYGTSEGHTASIANFMADVAEKKGLEVELLDSSTLTKPLTNKAWDAVIVGGSVHQVTHQMSLRAFVQNNLNLLKQRPSAFFSVSLSAAVKDDMHQEEARGYATSFLEDVAWQPLETAWFAGAIKHGEYDYFKEMVLRLLARQLGGDMVKASDVSYTDWQQVKMFVEGFLQHFPVIREEASPR